MQRRKKGMSKRRMGRTPSKRGKNAELSVIAVLQELQDQGVIDGYVSTRYYSKKYSALESQGIDCIVVRDGLGMPLQVKSRGWVRAHKAKYPFIPVVSTGVYYDLPFVKRRILKIFEDAPSRRWKKRWYLVFQEWKRSFPESVENQKRGAERFQRRATDAENRERKLIARRRRQKTSEEAPD
ncbi:hypothetical protein ACFL11_01550 [Patescibacteria group bacterium]